MKRGSVLTVLLILAGVLLLVGGVFVLFLADDPVPPAQPVDGTPRDVPPVDDDEPEPEVADFAVPDTPFPRPEKGAVFVPEEAEDLLVRVDFDVLGEHVAAAVPLLQRLSVALTRGEQLEPETFDRLETARRVVHDHLAGLEPELGDEAPFGVYCHPLVAANTIERVLALRDRPLTDAQMHRMQVVLDEHWKQDRERRATRRDDGDAWFAEHVLAEAQWRQRFYDAALAVLTKPQRARLRPDIVRGRVGLDLFSTAYMWSPFAATFPSQRDERLFIEGLVDFVCPKLGMPPQDDDHLQAMWDAVTAWRKDLPEGYFGTTRSLLDLYGHFRARHMEMYVRESRRLLEAILGASPPLFGKRIRRAPTLIVFALEPQ